MQSAETKFSYKTNSAFEVYKFDWALFGTKQTCSYREIYLWKPVEMRINWSLEALGLLVFRRKDHQSHFLSHLLCKTKKIQVTCWNVDGATQSCRHGELGVWISKTWNITSVFAGFALSRSWCKDRQSENSIKFVIGKQGFPMRFWWKDFYSQKQRNACFQTEGNDFQRNFLDFLDY